MALDLMCQSKLQHALLNRRRDKSHRATVPYRGLEADAGYWKFPPLWRRHTPANLFTPSFRSLLCQGDVTILVLIAYYPCD